MSATILVTGGAGYIGSHMTHALADRGDRVVVLDNLSTGIRGLINSDCEFVEGDIGDIGLVRDVLKARNVDAIVHFAGSVVVPDSVTDPLRYYANNTTATRNLIEACVAENIDKFVFSSTAAVYGVPGIPLVNEETPKHPINPYGRSKLMAEWMLEDAARAYDFRYVALRYFNVAGADPRGRTGQSTRNATHLIKRACQAALGRISHLDIFGTDFSTPDGTGVRDFIHVSDLITAHLLALDALRDGATAEVFNCGYGRGLSVREIIAAIEQIAGVTIRAREAPRRPGDPAMLVADSSKLKRTLHWAPQYENIDAIVRTAYDWERRLNH